MNDATDTPAQAPNAETPSEAPADAHGAAAPRQRRARGGRGRNKSKGDGPAESQGEQRGTDKAKGQAQASKPHPVLEKLFELYPALFGARFLPLMRGVYEELLARHPDVFQAEDLKLAMGLHARSTRYLECVAAGQPRHGLDGQVVEPMAPEHVHHAIVELYRRRLGRAPAEQHEALREQLRDRLVKAIEQSGLSRTDYATQMRTRNEEANAALDAALEELGRRDAKAEALLRAFEASGKSEAEFADMYGMSHSEVARSLQRARQGKTASVGAAQ